MVLSLPPWALALLSPQGRNERPKFSYAILNIEYALLVPEYICIALIYLKLLSAEVEIFKVTPFPKLPHPTLQWFYELCAPILICLKQYDRWSVRWMHDDGGIHIVKLVTIKYGVITSLGIEY